VVAEMVQVSRIATKQKGKGLEFPSFKAVYKTCFVFIPIWGVMIQFDEHIFQTGWGTNHPTRKSFHRFT